MLGFVWSSDGATQRQTCRSHDLLWLRTGCPEYRPICVVYVKLTEESKTFQGESFLRLYLFRTFSVHFVQTVPVFSQSQIYLSSPPAIDQHVPWAWRRGRQSALPALWPTATIWKDTRGNNTLWDITRNHCSVTHRHYSFTALKLIALCLTSAVFRHDLQVKSGELATDFTRSSPFTHVQHRGRFSAQTRSKQHQILRVIRARGGAAGCSRQRQEVTY